VTNELYIQEDLLGAPDEDADTRNMRSLLSRYAGIKDDAHGADTPHRFLNMLDELTMCRDVEDFRAQEQHELECIKWKAFPSDGMRDMIVVERIPFVSVCNHHLAPFTGFAHIGYVPDKEMAGLSKFARVVRHFARQPQVQERLTKQIADYLEDQLEPMGVGVVMQAEHMCMTIRGIQVPGTKTTTSTMRGVFGNHERTAKMEFLQIVNSRG